MIIESESGDPVKYLRNQRGKPTLLSSVNVSSIVGELNMRNGFGTCITMIGGKLGKTRR